MYKYKFVNIMPYLNLQFLNTQNCMFLFLVIQWLICHVHLFTLYLLYILYNIDTLLTVDMESFFLCCLSNGYLKINYIIVLLHKKTCLFYFCIHNLGMGNIFGERYLQQNKLQRNM